MPTVPIEQNKVGIADVTDAKLRPGDYSGTGLQALGAGMQTLGEGVAKVADEAHTQALYDDAAVKKSWNDISAQSRPLMAHFFTLRGFDAGNALQSTVEQLTALQRDAIAALPTDRQRKALSRSAGPRLDQDLARIHRYAESQIGVAQGGESGLLQENAAHDAAAAHADDPNLSRTYIDTGANAIAEQAGLAGTDPAATEQAVTAYRSGVHLRIADGLVTKDPVAAAEYYRAHRDEMTAADQRTFQNSLFEPLARWQGATDVDSLIAMRPDGGRGAAASPEDWDATRQTLEAQPWGEERKRRARDEIHERIFRDEKARRQAADAAKDAALAEADRLGPDFQSIAQLPPAMRRDLPPETETALTLRAARNLDSAPIEPHGMTSLMMNVMAAENPAAFAKEDLRLVRDQVTPDEYEALVRVQRGAGGFPPAGDGATLRRAWEAAEPAIASQTGRYDAAQSTPHSGAGMTSRASPLGANDGGLFHAVSLGSSTNANASAELGRDGEATDSASPGPAALRTAVYWKDGAPDSFGDYDNQLMPTAAAATRQMPSPFDQTDIGPISGYPESGRDSWRAANDRVILDGVNKFNRDHKFKPGDPGYMWASTIKAQAMLESGGSKSEFLRDPMQVNKPGDWADEKIRISGLTDRHQTMTPSMSVDAGLKWLFYKSHTTVNNNRNWIGIERGLARYNTVEAIYPNEDNLPHKKYYAKKILELSTTSQITKPTWKVCVPDSWLRK